MTLLFLTIYKHAFGCHIFIMKYSYRWCVCVCLCFTCRPRALSRSQCKMLESLEVIPQHVSPITAEAYDIIRRYLIKVRPLLLHSLRV